MQLGELQKIEGELLGRGYRIVALSADRPEKLGATIAKHELGYTLLSDARMQASRAYGVAFQLGPAEVARYKEFGVDLEGASGETHHLLPVPSVFLVDTSGVIRFGYSNPDYKVRLPTDQLLAAAEAATPRAEAVTRD